MRGTRYLPSRRYLAASLTAMGLGGVSAWIAAGWAPAYVPAGLFAASAAALAYLATRPPIEVRAECLTIGKRRIRWSEIRRVERTGWMSPLVVRLRLADGSLVRLVYPGEAGMAGRLLRQLRRCATGALLDGIPYRQFWGKNAPNACRRSHLPPAPAPKVLREEDEAEVERLYQRLKSVGHLDAAGPEEESGA